MVSKYFVTTMNRNLYHSFGHRLLESYEQTNQSIPMHVYCEDGFKELSHKNVTWLNLFQLEPECQAFVKRNNDKKPRGFMEDAVRFCYKVFAQCNASRFGEKMYYVDADSVFMKKIPDEWFEKCLPDDVFTSFYHREGLYTETGFIAFNNLMPCAKGFYDYYKTLYISDDVYKLAAQTDCHTFDRARRKYNQELDNDMYKEKRLGDGAQGHIMARDKFIGPYIDHRKGKRKEKNQSPEWVRENHG
tara:strand:- start:51 stop:785 length:735 start_codon:yes stop_codon:yes gene_type:complete